MTCFLKHKIGGIFFDICFVATICAVANYYSPLQVLSIGIKPVVDIQNGALLNPLHCLTEKPVSFLLASRSVLSTHTAGFVIEYLSSLAVFTDCCYLNNYSDRTALTENSVRTCFVLGIAV
jgi:hypothetical protein